MIVEAELYHYGTPRHSGRYPWGSGENPYQRSKSFMGIYQEMHKKGMSDKEIAEALGMKLSEFRSRKTISRNQVLKEEAALAMRLKEKGYSKAAIAERLGKPNESSVRSLLAQAEKEKNQTLFSTVDLLKKEVAEKGYLDVGLGTESHLGISQTKLKAALQMLEDEGYLISYTNTQQISGKNTSLVVLAAPGTTHKDVWEHRFDIKTVAPVPDGEDIKDLGKLGISLPVKSVDSSRVQIKYAEDGGLDADGIIELRRGVEDISLGGANYAQVRIGVDGKYYLKGVAIYADDLPDGVDIRFNTNKHRGTPMEKVLKEMDLTNPDNPFGASVREHKNSNGELSSLYIVNEEGDWENWTKRLSAQFLSKQKPELARKQLDLTYDQIREEYDEIMSITNPVVRRQRLREFSDQCDSDAVHLKSAALPRQTSSVILPFTSIKENEVYAPNYENGERVVLVRYPHGSISELPELTVNNRNPQARKLIGNASDAIGINPRTAGILSGADFDGDTVMVIPNNNGMIRGRSNIPSSSPLLSLKDFDPKETYPYYEGMRVMKKGQQTQQEMGKISNLITDMTLKMARDDEIARAIRHSMVVIDAAKHKLDYERSFEENGIAALKEKYQGGTTRGAATLISKSSSKAVVPERKEGYRIDKATGEKIFVETGGSYVKTKRQEDGTYTVVKTRTGEPKVVKRTTESTKMYEAKDARELSSGTPMEEVYASYANRLKALANEARKEAVNTPGLNYRPSARETYSHEVATLKAKLTEAEKQRPLERQATIAMNATTRAKVAANPELYKDKKVLKRLQSQSLAAERARVGKKDASILITDSEWEAIQSGAIRTSMLEDILKYADKERVRELSTPRKDFVVTPAVSAKAKAMAANGYTQAEIASVLGISAATVAKIL